MGVSESMRGWLRVVAVVLVPLLLLPLPIVLNSTEDGRTGQEWSAAYVVLLMGVFWVFELLPLAVTSLIPVVLLPMMGIVSTEEISHYYMKGTGMLFVSGLMVAIAVEHSNLHRRIALSVLSLFGTSPRMLMLGFMLPTMFLSMWISNTATSVLMIPILEAVLSEIGADENVTKMMFLAICYSANVGGTGTLIGTPPNLIMYDFLEDFADQPVNFLSWMGYSVAQMLVNVFLIWIFLQVLFQGFTFKQSSDEKKKEAGVRLILKKKILELGDLTWHESVVSVTFTILVALWFFRDPDFMTGWAPAISPGGNGFVKDATPALAMLLPLFVLPANPAFWPKRDAEGRAEPSSGEPCLTWEVVEKKMAWGVVILIGGGYAASAGADASGLMTLIGKQLEHLEALSDVAILFLILIMMSATTQIASNAATTSMLVPVIKTLAIKLQVNPLFFMLPATLVASCAFMLPMSTGPNAIVFATGKLKTVDMIKAGFGLNIITMLVIVANNYTFGVLMFSVTSGLPDWVVNNATVSSILSREVIHALD